MTLRRPGIVFPKQIDPVFVEEQPELSYLLFTMSLLAEYGEPYLIRVMGKAKRYVKDPKLREAISLLNGQEGQHFRLHKAFNNAIGVSCPALETLKAGLKRDYELYLSTRSLKWNLAYAVGTEAMTVAFATFMLEDRILRDAVPFVRDLFEWHAIEELEHRSVAFDVYEHLYGGYAYRVAVGALGQRDFYRFSLGTITALLEQNRATGRDLGTRAQVRARVIAFCSQLATRLMPKVAVTFSPRYTPDKVGMPAGAGAVLQRLAGWDPVAELAASDKAAAVRRSA